MTNEPHDPPVPQRLKVIDFLDLIPGYAEQAQTGEKIMILTVAHGSDIEHPMMLSIKDGWNMAMHIMACLSFHGDDKAREILAKFPRRSGGKVAAEDEKTTDDEVWDGPPICERTGQTMEQVEASPQPFLSPLIETGITMSVKTSEKASKPLTLHVLGGYRRTSRNSPMMLMVRCFDFGPYEFLVHIGPKGMVRLRDHAASEALPKPEWLGFALREPGHEFQIGGSPTYQKMSCCEIRQTVGRRRVFIAFTPEQE